MRRGAAADARLLAYHEAGHAVAAFVLKRPLGPVSLHPLQPSEPGSEPAGPGVPVGLGFEPDPFVFEDGERDVIVLLAGAQAEAILTGDCDWYAAETDRERADALLARMVAAGYRARPRDEQEGELVGGLGDDAVRRDWEVLLHRTQALVQQDPVRSAIAAVAAALLAGGTLDPQQVQRAIRQGIAAADPDQAG
jgi:hypothetical protein